MTERKSKKIPWLVFASVLIGLVLAELSWYTLALGWILMASIILLSQTEEEGPIAKILLTSSLGIVGLFIYVNGFGIPANGPDHRIYESLKVLAHAIHLDIFVFLAGLYMVVNTFAYSGIIGDLAWRIVKATKGRLGKIMVAIMILTCLLSGIFDGATVTTIMGIITLTILLSSGMQVSHIVQILLLLVVATNIGGVWFVLGEPTNILAAAKLRLSPFFFLKYAFPFSVPVAVFCAISAYRIVKRYPPIQADRPEIEVLLEGISLRRTHHGTGTLLDTLRSLGTVELRHLEGMEKMIQKEGVPDFESALKAGIPKEKVYDALSVNLNSQEMASGLIDYYYFREDGDPMAEILIGDLLYYVREEYKSRTQSRTLVMTAGLLLIALLVVHALVPAFPNWLSTIVAGLVAIVAVQKNTRRVLIHQTWDNMIEAFFLIAIFATISEINLTGAFTTMGEYLMNLGSPLFVGMGILTGSAIISSMADNIAVMDVLTNLIIHHTQWPFFALAGIIGTALGGFVSPIASVQAVIMATIVRRVAKVSWGRWILLTLKWFIILLAICLVILMIFHFLHLPGETLPHV